MPPRVFTRFAPVFAVLLLVLSRAREVRAADDPSLKWSSLETPHFRITYYSGEEEIAQHIADLTEAIYARLSPAVGWVPGSRTEILLTDQTDSANGSATALPYNAVRLFVTAPDDLSPLGDVDDWYQELVTHEYTHILHTDHVRGLPSIANALIGKTYAPNQAEPRWMLEGLAVYEETDKTSGGRLRSSIWNMFMRADVLEHNLAPLDQFSNNVRRWPQGNIWYLYGSFFMRWIAETYGERAIRAFIDDYGWQVVPYSMNRSMRRATGKTFEELYPSWVASLQQTFGAQREAVIARGVREGIRLTHFGQTSTRPRFIPAKAFGGKNAGDLLWDLDDGHDRAGFYRIPLDRDASGAIKGAREADRELLVRLNGDGSASFTPDGGVVFSSTDITKNLFAYNDLFALAPGLESPSGLEGNRVRLTTGFRATDPDVSPDGRRVVFVTNHRGTTYLQIADRVGRGDEEHLENVRALVKSGPFDQAYTPRFSPDNVHVAYSAWRRGGYRDVRIVDTRDGSYVEVTHDRAIDGDPSYSPDGRWLFFHSDRSGILNVYAYEVATGALRQVTNVVNGAVNPEVSPDGRTLIYVGYTHQGYDLFAMPCDPAAFFEPLPYLETRPPPPAEPAPRAWPRGPYDPLRTLLPRRYSVQIAPGDFGEALTVSASGADLAGHHSIAASITSETERADLQGSLDYTYSRLPVDLNLSVYRSVSPRGGFSLGSYKPAFVQETVGASSGVSYAMPRAFDGQSFSLSYNYQRIAGDLTFPVRRLNPYDTPSFPLRGNVGSVHLGWSYSNAESYLWSVGPERGISLGAGLEVADQALASDFSGYTATAGMGLYQRMPWLRHHALALHAQLGTSGGSYPGRGGFFVGGFVDLPVIDTVRNNLIQGGIVLRGYPVGVEAGGSYALFNAEYRFPILNVDRGPSTLPIFLQRISGAAFVDYGSAFDRAAAAQFKTGTGGELWFDTLLGYIINFTFRVGYAHGWASEGLDKVYLVAAVAY